MPLILLGALNDQNLNPWGLTPLILKLVITGIIMYLVIFKTPLKHWVVRYRFWLVSLLTITAIIWQFMLVFNISAPIGFDVGTIHQSLVNHKVASGYLSLNPNNFFLFYFQHTILNLFNLSPSWINVNLLNLVCLDLSLGLNAVSIYVLNHRALLPLLILQDILMLLLVQVIVPYSDVMVLPFVSLMILGFVIAEKGKNTFLKYYGVVVCAIGALSTYLMKPSSIIFILAVLLWMLFNFSAVAMTRKKVMNYVIAAGLFGIIFFGGVSSFKHFEYHDKLVNVTKDQGEPATHFMAMGVSDRGGWNAEQVAKTQAMKTNKERSDYSQKIIQQRFKEYGIIGFIQFFINKNYANTSDGTFGWYHGDEPYIVKPAKTKLQSIFYEQGTHFHDYQFLAQIFWIMNILLLGLGFAMVDKYTQIFRLAIMGGLLFLLLFEGGRSRYLIQFLPLMLMLNALTFAAAKEKLKQLKMVFSSQ
ncbi:integral membrane protein [Fructilactobacillus lindneri DSM 20690 = JCM 11027]|uniref:Integral membrane protein n=2 Tax=Fructilactobacillus lindneri TaxID=53444 RepID=A0A0R2JNU8_9LACO|nr:integral membrane protein [Fructilactobacillus lindneri DSM 20690 = JCM 11027]